MARSASIERNTLETQISVSIELDGSGVARMDTGVPFLEHMLDQIARHGLIDFDIAAKGDLHIDAHHTVEDLGITLGQAFARAIGDKKQAFYKGLELQIVLLTRTEPEPSRSLPLPNSCPKNKNLAG